MKSRFLIVLPMLAILAGCETIQTPRDRQQQALREQASSRYAEERMRSVQGQVGSMEMQYAQVMQEVQQLRDQLRSSNNQISQLSSQVSKLSSSMQALEAKQAREMLETLDRVRKILNESVASTPTASRGSGREHTVDRGHTLSTIAQAYNTTVDKIKKANNLKSDVIVPGQKLFIPD